MCSSDLTVQALRERLPASAQLQAWLGPCIGPQAFEVGPEVPREFQANGFDTEAFVRAHVDRPGKWLMSLAGLAHQRLAQLGVRHVAGNDGSEAWCTVGDATRWFSHRRDRVSGRLAALVWRV